MKNTIFFENGIKHDLTKDEITVLKIAMSEFVATLPPERNAQYMVALENLKSLFLEHLD